MGNYSAPGISRGSKIYRMASTRNHRVLITSLVILVFGILALYDGIVRPGAQTPVSIILVFIIIGVSLYGFYLFLTRSWDVFMHPDVKKFLSTGDPRRFIDLFEQESASGNLKKFKDVSVTRSFVVSETFYRFRWAYAKEIKIAYVERPRISSLPIPFIGVTTVVVHLDNGTSMHVNCDSAASAEALLKTLSEIAPSASYVSFGFEKSQAPADYEADLRDVVGTIKNMPDIKGTDGPAKKIVTANARDASKLVSDTPVATAKPEPARPAKLTKEEIFDRQIKELYNSLEKENIPASLTIIGAIGEDMNTAATDILAMLLEYPDDAVRAQAAFSLGMLGQQASVEPLIQALDDSSAQVRENAAVALGKIGDQRAVAPLQQVPTSDVRVKKAAVGALARIDQKLNIFNQPGNVFFNTLK